MLDLTYNFVRAKFLCIYMLPLQLMEVTEWNTRREFTNIKEFYDAIKNELGTNLGFACAHVTACDNDFRKEIISEGLKAGFKVVKIISYEVAKFLDMISQCQIFLNEGDVCGILSASNTAYIWKKTQTKYKYITNVLDENSIAEFKPLLFIYPNGRDVTKYQQALPKCKFMSVKRNNTCYGAWIKARIMANDPEVANYDCFDRLGYDVLHAGKIIIDKDETLPCKKDITTVKDGEQVVFKFPGKWVKLPVKGKYVINIDSNGLYDIQKAVDSKSFTTTVPLTPSKNDNTSTLGRMFPSLKLSTQLYKIPQKIANYDSTSAVVGIDLGTSRCCAAVIRKNGVETVALDNLGERLLPSYVAYDEEKPKCGQIVIDRLRHYSSYTIYDAKRIIGKQLSSVVRDPNWPFELRQIGTEMMIEVQTWEGKQCKYPEAVSATLLRFIKAKAQDFKGRELPQAVITVPAVFSEEQKNKTMVAAAMAGWDTVELLPEPVAAAFAYFANSQLPANQTVLIFDLGGGTLDICLFKVVNGQIEIISSNGDSNLGGRDFDNVLIDYFTKEIEKKFQIHDLKAKKYKLMIEAQKIKHNLSVRNNDHLDIDDYDTTKEGLITITRAQFEQLSISLLDRIRTLLITVANQQTNIAKVLLVGGGCKMPMIKALLKEMFPSAEQCCEEHPDEVVAIGAAYYAYSIFTQA